MRLVEACNEMHKGVRFEHLVPYITSLRMDRSFLPKATLEIDFKVNQKFLIEKVIDALKDLKTLNYKGVTLENLSFQGIEVDLSANGKTNLQVIYRYGTGVNPNSFRLSPNEISLLNELEFRPSIHTHRSSTFTNTTRGILHDSSTLTH